MKATRVTVPAIRVVALSHTGPYGEIGEKFERVWSWVGESGAEVKGCYAIYYQDPKTTPEEELKSDACIAVSDDLVLDPKYLDLRITEIPAGDYATTAYLGPYSGLIDAWQEFLDNAIPEAGFKLCKGVSFEQYVGDPSHDDPESLRTDLFDAIE